MMHNNPNDSLCHMLAFQTAIANSGIKMEESASKILALAKQMDDFCNLYELQTVQQVYASAEEDQISDLVLKKLDEEIDGVDAGVLR